MFSRVSRVVTRITASRASLVRSLPVSFSARPHGLSLVRHLSSGGSTILKVPGMGDSITEGALVKWLKKKGDYVALDEIVLVIETDKVAVDVRSPTAGILEETMAAVGDTVKVGADLAKIKAGGAPPAGAPAAAAAASSSAAAPVPSPAKVAAPAPTPAPAAPKPAPAATPVAAPAQPVKAGAREESRVKMTRMRMRIAQRCVNGVNILAQAMQGSQALKFLPLAK